MAKVNRNTNGWHFICEVLGRVSVVGDIAFQFKTLEGSKEELRDITLGEIVKIIILLLRNFTSLALHFFSSLTFQYVWKISSNWLNCFLSLELFSIELKWF